MEQASGIRSVTSFYHRILGMVLDPEAQQFHTEMDLPINQAQSAFLQHTPRGDILRMHQANNPFQASMLEAELERCLRGFCRQPLPPERFAEEVCNFGFARLRQISAQRG